MGASLTPDPRQVKPAKGTRRGRRTGDTRPCFPLTRRGGRRNCRASRLHATRTGPPRESPTLPSLPRGRRRRGRLLAATYLVLGPLAGPATALPRTNAAARVTLAGVRIPPRD